MEIQINQFRMAYHETGEGQPLLLVHGYPLNLNLWQAQFDGLAGEARVLAVDLRGHGDSQPVPGPYSMDLFADDLNAVLDALGIDQPVVLGGLSMGGYLRLLPKICSSIARPDPDSHPLRARFSRGQDGTRSDRRDGPSRRRSCHR